MNSSLEKLIKGRLEMLNMKTFHTIIDYMKSEDYIKDDDSITLIYDQISKMNTNMAKESMIFEIAAHKIGLITEEQLKDIITNFRGLEVVSLTEIEKMDISFLTFSKEMCKKNTFFEYIEPNSINRNIVASFTTGERINTLLKRTFSDFRIRYTLPSIIELFLEKV